MIFNGKHFAMFSFVYSESLKMYTHLEKGTKCIQIVRDARKMYTQYLAIYVVFFLSWIELRSF